MENNTERLTSYLSKSEIKVVCGLAHLDLEINGGILDRNISQEEKDALAMVSEAFKLYKRAVFKRVDSRGIKRLRAWLKNYVLQLTPVTESEFHKNIMIPTDSWYTLVEFLFREHCGKCHGKKHCSLRNALSQAEVPEYRIPDDETAICEYQYLDCVK